MAALRRRASSSSTTASTCCSAGCRATDRYWLGVLTPSSDCSSCAAACGAEESGKRLHVSPTSESSMWMRQQSGCGRKLGLPKCPPGLVSRQEMPFVTDVTHTKEQLECHRGTQIY